jgi:tetratricopeptide (TPR) repeat protein
MDLPLEQLMLRGRQAYERRDYLAALTDFREILQRQPTFADIHHLAALSLSFLGQPEAALEEFERAIELNEGYVEAHLNRAITLNELGRYDEAANSFERAWKHETKADAPFPAAVTARLANAHMSLGDLYLEAGGATEAVQQYRSALELRPRFLDIRNKLATALMQLGDLESAENELRAALDLNPRFISARLNLGLVHYRRGNGAEARAEWEAAGHQQPGNAQVRAYLAMAQRKASA